MGTYIGLRGGRLCRAGPCGEPKAGVDPVASGAGPDLPIVSIVVPFFGVTKSILRIPEGNPKRNHNGDYR